MNILTKSLTKQQVASLERCFFECFPEKLASEFESYLQNDAYHIEIAEVEGQVATFIIIQVIKPEAEILQIGTAIDHRNKGYAKLLINMIFEKFNVMGFDKFYLEVAANNISAINLYKAVGFKQDYVRKNYYKNNNEMIDAICMSCLTSL